MEVKVKATDIVKKLVRSGYKAYFAGGWVRDYVMGHPSSDIDIATDAPPENILDLFPHTILVGLAFGVVIVVLDGHQFEVSTFRKDINYVNGRKPELIELSTPQEDAKRRDFTINGMFYDPLEGIIYDYVQGIEDIKAGIIRTIGDPDERFSEDRLRMIRAVRFAYRFGFTIDPDTRDAIAANAETLFPAVAMERIWQEFNKMAQYPRFDQALIDMHRLGLLQVIFPELQGVHLNDIKHRTAIFGHFPKDCPTIHYIIELFPETPLKELMEKCQYLRTSGNEAKLVEFVFKGKQLIALEEGGSQVDVVDWVYFYSNPHSQICLDIVAASFLPNQALAFLNKHQERKIKLREHIQRVIEKKPLVSADMLKTHGIPQSKLMGELLKNAENYAIRQDVHDAEAAIAYLKSMPLWKTIN